MPFMGSDMKRSCTTLVGTISDSGRWHPVERTGVTALQRRSWRGIAVTAREEKELARHNMARTRCPVQRPSSSSVLLLKTGQ